jgi:ubiquinone/menaquinone biosynthesis C-methylase UbiE
MAILIKQLFPDVHVWGLDPDPKALSRAKRKAGAAAVSIQFDQGFSDNLPYADASFDRVFSCFMFHHLAADQKESTFCEMRRVLKPEGSFHLVDFAGPEGDGNGWLTHLFHSSEQLKDNSEARIVALTRRAGFLDAKKVMERRIALGALRVSYFCGSAKT